MRSSYWSSDVCSSDLSGQLILFTLPHTQHAPSGKDEDQLDFTLIHCCDLHVHHDFGEYFVRSVRRDPRSTDPIDRKSVVKGKSGNVRVNMGGRSLIKQIRMSLNEKLV